jgi:tetratricopeptide (TPR) repeat protein
MLGNYAAAQTSLELGLKTAREVGNALQEFFALSSMTWLHAVLGQFRQCLEAQQSAAELNASIRNSGFTVTLEIYRSIALQDAGQFGESLRVARSAISKAETGGSMERLLVARQRWALMHLAFGDLDAASNRFRLERDR